MKHELNYDENIGAVRLNFVGLFLPQDEDKFLARLDEITKDKDIPFMLCDFKNGDMNLPKDRSYRKWLAEMSKKTHFLKTAIINTSPAARMIAKVALVATGKSHTVRFCKGEKDAVDWFNEKGK
ncbi:hypothetical protein JXM67_05860 [candidate division WOR-3 bacterium]|nr:hypothetical protein [candidate division WOR-3 bacterium]